MRRFIVSELSMSPALVPGDRFLARRVRLPRRGQVLFFAHPHRLDFWLVKRIIGLPAEQVVIREGKVRIDDADLQEPWTVDVVGPDGCWDVPKDHAFVLSDARTRSAADSRTIGPVSLRDSYVAFLRYRRGHR